MVERSFAAFLFIELQFVLAIGWEAPLLRSNPGYQQLFVVSMPIGPAKHFRKTGVITAMLSLLFI